MNNNAIITLGRFRKNINLLCNNIREIFHSNYSFVTLFFLLLYSFEQGLLLFFSIKLSPELAFGIGLFILIMLTTISIERLLMESKNKRLSELYAEMRSDYRTVSRKYFITKRRLKKFMNLKK